MPTSDKIKQSQTIFGHPPGLYVLFSQNCGKDFRIMG